LGHFPRFRPAAMPLCHACHWPSGLVSGHFFRKTATKAISDTLYRGLAVLSPKVLSQWTESPRMSENSDFLGGLDSCQVVRREYPQELRGARGADGGRGCAVSMRRSGPPMRAVWSCSGSADDREARAPCTSAVPQRAITFSSTRPATNGGNAQRWPPTSNRTLKAARDCLSNVAVDCHCRQSSRGVAHPREYVARDAARGCARVLLLRSRRTKPCAVRTAE